MSWFWRIAGYLAVAAFCLWSFADLFGDYQDVPERFRPLVLVGASAVVYLAYWQWQTQRQLERRIDALWRELQRRSDPDLF